MHTYLRFAAVIVVSLSMVSAIAQEQRDDVPTYSPVYSTRGPAESLELVQRFTSIVDHDARILEVLDFDSEVIGVEPYEGNPQRIRVYALEPGVTTITLIDEHGERLEIEVHVRADVRYLASILARHYPNDPIQVEEIKGAIQLKGWVTRPEHIEEIKAIAEQFYPTVLNHLRVGGAQQVQLRCTIMEVQRSKIRKMGLNWGILDDTGFVYSTPGPITPVNAVDLTGGIPAVELAGFSNASISFGKITGGRIFEGYLQALREEGLLKIHATPMLVTHNGRPANLLNGGESPIAVPAGLGTTGVQFKEFGIRLQAVPRILGEGRLRLELEAEVSERDVANTVNINGTPVQGFNVRRANTEVELAFGRTIVIAGLISHRETGTAQKIPLLGELPWVGTAFSKKQYEQAETELVILVTPEYVAPLPTHEIPPGGPGRFTDIPTDHELYFQNHLEVPRFGDDCEMCYNGYYLNGAPCPSCKRGSGACGRCGGNCGEDGCLTQGASAPGMSAPPQNGGGVMVRPASVPTTQQAPSAGPTSFFGGRAGSDAVAQPTGTQSFEEFEAGLITP